MFIEKKSNNFLINCLPENVLQAVHRYVMIRWKELAVFPNQLHGIV